jgi:hypothetical protein
MYPPIKSGLTGALALTCLAAWLGATPAAAAAGFRVNPATVTNDYFGAITLTLTNLPTSGQSVRVEKYYDLNGNGAVDAGDWLMQSFLVTDGGRPSLGGVTNLNLPGDTDGAANGQIVAQLNYPGLDTTFSLIEGPYLYRVSSPSNAFPPMTQTFGVSQKTQAQSVTGTLYSGTLGNGLSNAIALAFDLNFNPVGGTKANASGRYTLYVPAGDVTVWPFLKGYLASQNAGYTNVTAGQALTNLNVGLQPGTNSLSGALLDARSGVGVPGVAIYGYQGQNLFSITFCDTNGNYQLPVTADAWQIQYNRDQMPMLGYLAANGQVTTNLQASITNFNLRLTNATALLYGSVRNDQTPSNLLAGVRLGATDKSGAFQSGGMTYSSNGLYTIGVAAGNWWVQPDSGSLATLGCLGAGANWAIGSNQTARLDFVARKITAHLQGITRDIYTAEPGVGLQATDPTHTWTATATSDANGNFSLGVFAGTWQVGLDSDTASGWYAVGTNLVATVTTGQTLANLNYLFRYANGYLLGGVVDTNGLPLGGIAMHGLATLAPGIGAANYVAYSDDTGTFYTPIFAGRWTNNLDCFGGNGLTFPGYECVSAQAATLIASGNNLPSFVARPLANPTLTQLDVSAGGVFGFTVTGPTSRTYQVLASTNLRDWSTVFATNPIPGQFRYASTNVPGTAVRSYRALVQ